MRRVFLCSLGILLASAMTVTAAPAVTGGLVFYYSFDDITNSGDDVIVEDGSGNDMDGTVRVSASTGNTSTITFVPGVYGNCAQFDVSNPNDAGRKDFALIEIVDMYHTVGCPEPEIAGDYSSFAYLNNGDEPDPADIPTDAMTFACWLNVELYDNSHTTFVASAFDPDHGVQDSTQTHSAWPYHLQVESSSKNCFRYTIRKDGGDGVQHQTLVNETALMTSEGNQIEANQINGRWAHLAWTFSEADATWAFYLDGVKMASGVPDSGEIYDNWDVGAALGCGMSIGRQLLGQMDEAYLFKRCLSDSEIATLAANPGLQGDLNNDGFVNSGDLDLVRGNWGTNNTAGDANGDGVVNSGDLDIVRANWGAHTAAAVPEPGAFVLLGFLGLLACLKRR